MGGIGNFGCVALQISSCIEGFVQVPEAKAVARLGITSGEPNLGRISIFKNLILGRSIAPSFRLYSLTLYSLLFPVIPNRIWASCWRAAGSKALAKNRFGDWRCRIDRCLRFTRRVASSTSDRNCCAEIHSAP